MKRILFMLPLIAFVGVIVAFTTKPPQDDWEVPGKYKKMENPYTDMDEAMDIGRALYSKHCKSCHGKKGAGDGTKAGEIETPMRAFASADVQDQSDGELYYKTTFGRDDMPAYDKKIPSEEDRWLLVTYMRSFK